MRNRVLFGDNMGEEMSEAALPLKPLNSEGRQGAVNGEVEAGETTPGHDAEVRWVVVKNTNGLLPAQIIAGSLQAAEIPALAWQEGAGRALGLTVGLLGNGYVSVPEPYEEQARDFLEMMNDLSADLDEEAWDHETWDDEETPADDDSEGD